MPTFTCKTCESEFDLAEAVLAKFPGWTPRLCMACKKKAPGAAPARKAARPTMTATQNLSLAQVLERYKEGPQDGVFTDGGAQPNPGRGGWGVVWVRAGDILAQLHGEEAHTTNNRMELTALIQAYRLVPKDQSPIIYCDSELAGNTAMKWAAMWERAGWKRKTGPIKNLDLVQELWALARARPDLKVEWIAAHNGWLWNEYADSLAGAHARAEL